MTSSSPRIVTESYTIILPTAEIVSEYRDYDAIFFFCEDGIKGVVKDIILSNTIHDPSGRAMRHLVDNIVTDYENSLHVRYMENTLGKYSPSIYIELIIEQLEAAIGDMLRQIFRDMLKTHRWDHRRYHWLGNDLIANLIHNEPKPPTRNPFS